MRRGGFCGSALCEVCCGREACKGVVWPVVVVEVLEAVEDGVESIE
jgi:hypothetical protein